MRHILLTLFTATLPLMPVVLHAQVTTATVYGVVRDATAASVPGAITVDGTDATANNETRGINSYGAQNQISD